MWMKEQFLEAYGKVSHLWFSKYRTHILCSCAYWSRSATFASITALSALRIGLTKVNKYPLRSFNFRCSAKMEQVARRSGLLPGKRKRKEERKGESDIGEKERIRCESCKRGEKRK